MAPQKPARLKSVLIVGLALQTGPHKYLRDQYDEVWAINNAGAHFGFKPTQIIAMDDLERDYVTRIYRSYVESIVNAGVPVYSARSHKKWKSVQPYPLAEVVKWSGLGESACRVLDNTCNYAIAMALWRGAKTIGLYGISFSRFDSQDVLELSLASFKDRFVNPPDWFMYYGQPALWWRRPTEPGGDAAHFWLGYGHAKGVRFKNSATTLMNADRLPFFYGYETQPRLGK